MQMTIRTSGTVLKEGKMWLEDTFFFFLTIGNVNVACNSLGTAQDVNDSDPRFCKRSEGNITPTKVLDLHVNAISSQSTVMFLLLT